MKKNSSTGFTLVELIVVIAIIAIVSTMGVVFYRNSTISAQDSERKAEINAIAKAYEANFDPVTGLYPDLKVSYFSNGIPYPPEGGNYSGLIPPDQTASGFQVCAALEAHPNRICGTTSETCFCISSSQGEYIAQASTPTVVFNTTIPCGTSVLTSPPAGSSCSMLNVSVTCQGLPARTVAVRKYTLANPSGAVLFTTGANGNRFYGAEGLPSNLQSNDTVVSSLNNNFETYEINWLGSNGIATGVTAGWGKATCGFADIARWIRDFQAAPSASGVMCATGNSGGGAQIAYGLAWYDLEDTLDTAILTGGPPLSRIDTACFGTDFPTYEDGTYPAGLQGRTLNDQITGWIGYCANFDPATSDPFSIPDSVKNEAYLTSIISSQPKDFSYGNSKVYFLEGGADDLRYNGKIYFDSVISPKSYEELPGVGHGVSGSNAGASKIRTILQTDCRQH